MSDDEVAGVGLSPNQLNKYRWRVEKLVEKVYSHEPLQLVIGKELIPNLITVEGKTFNPDVDNKEDVIFAIENISPFKKIYINGTVEDEEVKVVSSQVIKTPEFGGKPSGYACKLEHAMLGSVKSQLTVAIENNGGQPITIKAGPNNYGGIVDVVSTPGHPKSDIHFLNAEGEEVAFISHKAGKASNDFQQYSGVSKFIDHPEVITFIEDVKDYYGGDDIPSRGVKQRLIEDEELKLKSIYGHNFGNGEFGIDNVNLLIQGDVKLQQIGQATYDIAGSIMFDNGVVPDRGYEPSLIITYRTARSNRYFNNGRLGIWPTANIHKNRNDHLI